MLCLSAEFAVCYGVKFAVEILDEKHATFFRKFREWWRPLFLKLNIQKCDTSVDSGILSEKIDSSFA